MSAVPGTEALRGCVWADGTLRLNRDVLRAIIEEQYAKRLASLAKYTLGKDEIGYVLSVCVT